MAEPPGANAPERIYAVIIKYIPSKKLRAGVERSLFLPKMRNAAAFCGNFPQKEFAVKKFTFFKFCFIIEKEAGKGP